ncbi:MAG: transporter substrate-binding domain-containing protein [Sulfurimonas sp.]|uniref:HD domain-containing phosphohydrolase n=1 Tax=Sulfurimonas sp. TaxID=2022749 RepID=UPI0026366267|nr:HD domain-containing phosphohydrolase [Sulfurimonas sp.]MDD2651816.1 transporter substrate-binding domain-containing protein [Sulfurimonas sp.]MDD3451632.1 transporter substrate-binding domain-containing protein [Sulfurimonas sp.]
MKTLLLALLFLVALYADAPKELRVGIYENAPKIFTDANGNPSGFFVDILNDIAKKEGWSLTYKACQWQECLLMLENGELDIMPDVAYSKERERHFLFNKEIVISNWSTLFSNKKSKISSILDLDDKRIAVLENSIQQEQIEESFALFGVKPTLLSVKSFEEAFVLTQSGVVDAAIVNRHFGAQYFEKYNLIESSILLNPAALKFALTNKAENFEIAQRVDYHLDLIKKDRSSIYYTAERKWLEVKPKIGLPEWFYPFLIIASTLLLLLGSAVLFFRYLVGVKTKKIVQNAHHLQAIENEKAHNYRQVLYSLIAMIEQRDSYTAGHSQRVARYCGLIAKEMGYDEEEQALLYKAAMLHDIGKIATPDAILLKPEKLTQTEYAIIQEHVNVGIKILQDVPMFHDILEIIKHHHEKYDGSGYPMGVAKDMIPKLARVMMVADAFDAMTTNRIYKHKKSTVHAIEEIVELSGRYYHPEVIQAAVIALKEIDTSENVSQTPRTVLEEQRFVYFYKDSLTELYNAKYLEATLVNNENFRAFQKIVLISLHQFDNYNKKHGWEDGDRVLKEFAALLQKLFPGKALFRVRANDFIVLLGTQETIDGKKAEIREFLEAHKLSFDCIVKDAAQNQINSYETLKKFL